MFTSPIVVLDTETTGFDRHPWARVVELGAVRVERDGSLGTTFASLVKPDVLDDRAAEALAVNHITPAMLEDAPETAAVVGLFREFMADGDAFVTSYNRQFDQAFVERMGFRGARWASCVMLRAMTIMGPAGVLQDADPTHPRFRRDLPWLFPKLSVAAKFFGVEVEGDPHRALTDATTAAKIMVAIRRRELESA